VEYLHGPLCATFQAFILLYNTLILIYASMQLRYLISKIGWQLSINTSCVFLECLASLLRMAFFIDGFRFRGIFNEAAFYILLGISSPFATGSILLIAFYWQEVLMTWSSLGTTPLRFITKMRVPFAIILLIMCGIEIGSLITVLKGAEFPSLATTVFGILGSISLLSTAFFWTTGIRVMKIITKATEVKKMRKLPRLAKVIVGMATCNFISVLSIILQLTPAGGENPGYTMFLWWLFFTAFSTGSVLRIFIFASPISKTSSGDSSNLTASPTNKSTDMIEVKLEVK